jgi:hypothetical protein
VTFSVREEECSTVATSTKERTKHQFWFSSDQIRHQQCFNWQGPWSVSDCWPLLLRYGLPYRDCALLQFPCRRAQGRRKGQLNRGLTVVTVRSNIYRPFENTGNHFTEAVCLQGSFWQWWRTGKLLNHKSRTIFTQDFRQHLTYSSYDGGYKETRSVFTAPFRLLITTLCHSRHPVTVRRKTIDLLYSYLTVCLAWLGRRLQNGRQEKQAFLSFQDDLARDDTPRRVWGDFEIQA